LSIVIGLAGSPLPVLRGRGGGVPRGTPPFSPARVPARTLRVLVRTLLSLTPIIYTARWVCTSYYDGNYTTRVLPSFGLALLAGLHAMWEEFGQSLSLSRHRRVSSIAISNCDIPVCNCQSGFRCQTLNTKQVRGVPRQYIRTRDENLGHRAGHASKK
jgi:hypothetical protein